jgi:alkanesulfonate monooxygenase SsuD/methylene tetrahydromethanopterin reductase-like flavin-dependent oxidoreductase (luciferase family)
MHVGLLTLGDWLADPVTGQHRTPAQRHRSIVEQAVRAEAAGFSSVHLGEHHGSEYILSSPAVVLAAIAERTRTVRLSNGVALAANLDPVRVAEDYATVDALSGGRVEPCFGRGTIYPHVYAMFGQDEASANDRFAENVELIHRIWTTERVTWAGRFRTPLDDVAIHPRPTQPPFMWIGGGWSPASSDLAARLGCGLILPTVVGTWEQHRRIVDAYCERWEHYGHPVSARRIGACSHAFVGRDRAATRARWAPRYLHYLSSVTEWIRDSAAAVGREPTALPILDFETMVSTVSICGSPAEVVDRMGRAREVLSLDTHLLMLDMGGTPDDELFEAIDLCGAEVLPNL